MSAASQTRTDHIKKLAGKYFDLVGVTEVELSAEYRERYQGWLERDYHGSMEYMSRTAARRLQPKQVLPEVRGVIMVALNYYPGEHPELSEEDYKVARYAWGVDYHEVFEHLLAALLTELKPLTPSADYKAYVDYGPILEKAYAEQAGIGFIGKNSLIITEEYGSWVLLGSILTTLELVADKPAERRCGSCRRCLEHCPTRAIVADGLVDSRQCLSYQTIENKSGSIPEPIRQRQNRWGFGCDICQEVCPHNCRQKLTDRRQFRPPRSQSLIQRQQIQPLTETVFKTSFAHSPLLRAKKSGLLRNLPE